MRDREKSLRSGRSPRRPTRSVASGLLIAALLAAACGSGGADADGPGEQEDAEDPASNDGADSTDDVQAAADDEDVELTVWFGREDFIPGDAFDTFHEAHPNISVNVDVIPLEEVVSRLLRVRGTDAEPDIVQIEFEAVGPVVTADALMDIGPLIDRWQEEDQAGYAALSPAAWEMASVDDTTYGVAVHEGHVWFVYRKDWYEEAGLAHPPETWDDVLDAGRAFAEDGRIGVAAQGARDESLQANFYRMFNAMGGAYTEDLVPVLDSEGGIHLLEYYQTLVRDGITDPEILSWSFGEARAAFLSERAGQYMMGVNLYPTVAEEFAYGDEWAVAPPPARSGGEADYRGVRRAWPYYVTAGTTFPYEASLVLRYLASADIVGEVAPRYQPTTNLTVYENEELAAEQPWFQDLAEEIAALEPMPAHPRQPQIDAVVHDARQEALSNPDADAAEIAARYQDLILDAAEG